MSIAFIIYRRFVDYTDDAIRSFVIDDFVFIAKSKPSVAKTIEFNASFCLNEFSEMKSLTFNADYGALFFALIVNLDLGQILQVAWFGRVTLEVFACMSAVMSRTALNY
jgi:hypothetical protein